MRAAAETAALRRSTCELRQGAGAVAASFCRPTRFSNISMIRAAHGNSADDPHPLIVPMPGALPCVSACWHRLPGAQALFLTYSSARGLVIVSESTSVLTPASRRWCSNGRSGACGMQQASRGLRWVSLCASPVSASRRHRQQSCTIRSGLSGTLSCAASAFLYTSPRHACSGGGDYHTCTNGL